MAPLRGHAVNDCVAAVLFCGFVVLFVCANFDILNFARCG